MTSNKAPAQDSAIDPPGWLAPLKSVGDLANPMVTFTSGRLTIALEELWTNAVHVYSFIDPWAYRFSRGHNVRRVGSAFELKDSEWVAEHVDAPMRTARTDGLTHYVFSCVEGELEVLAVVPPEYSNKQALRG